MAISATSESSQFSQDSQIWDNLKQAIASSSGFQRWQLEHSVGESLQDHSLDSRVRRYLRETLETLAY
ncbi:MAG: hypothetical protein KME25_13235 [Symplocastrum torsivum CPER-KK1]|jgi:hypothetical protein|uniref:Uncharacterized protein n=1 Tax=Symplocastrum torsivum CPER-KK1 TaxID=450513 RepID=A0A951PMF4_9CYAN|nr:hypothetical protein [Symplocastrum torsivum CPER-KK1]